jgi:hypothetical protein
MGAAPLPPLVLGPQWTCTTTARSRAQALLTVRRNDSAEVAVEIQRCSAGRLRHAYPAGAHDVEVRIAEASTPELCTDVLRVLAGAIQVADPRCRRVVFAAPVDDLEIVAAAEAAGFRYVVDVEVPGEDLSLLVAEPEWVTTVDMDLDRVPGT